jgi:hypothetical protein
MNSRFKLAFVVAVVVLVGCATPAPPTPAPVVAPVAAPVERAAPLVVPPVALIEYPPLEPVAATVAPGAAPAPVVSPPRTAPAPEPVQETAVPTVTAEPSEPTEEQQLGSLLSDLQRFGAMNADEIRREQNAATQVLARQRNDFNRIRLAVLHTLAKTPQDDQRAMQLLDSVVKSNPGSPAAKQLAAVLQVQVAERMRAVRDEQQKADAAVKKLEALRNMERDLLRDRIGSGGGGGGGGSSGGGGGGGGG